MAQIAKFAPNFAHWGALLALSTFLVACGGGSGGSPSINPNPGNPGPSPNNVTVSGKITFDRIPFDATLGTGLNPGAPLESPARGVVVEAVNPAGSVLATALTNATGDYLLNVPRNTQMKVQAKAQMLKADAGPTWDFRVLNNTNDDALYALESSTFDSGAANSTRNLRASSGWGTTTRPASPFAVLDTVYRATELILTASSVTVFPPLNIYWSSSNKPTQGRFCIDDGDIGVTFYSTGGTDDEECDGRVPEGMYVLGDFGQGDTDEFDQHVLAHEFGHYVEAKFSRSDSIGGAHGDADKLDLRVAFGEGWGNAFSGMVLNDPVYRDSFSGDTRDFSFNMELDDARNDGWYSESSVGEILWDLADSTNESGDTVDLEFRQIFAAIVGGQSTTDALTSIFSFLATLQSLEPSQIGAINQLRNDEDIRGSDAFGVGETNNGGDPSALPVYRSIALNQVQQSVCVNARNGTDNKLGYNKFFRLDLSANALVTITVIGAQDPAIPLSLPAIDPDVFIYRRGDTVEAGIGTGGTETISQRPLTAGTYIIEVYDFDLASGSVPRCMTFSVTGT